MFLSFSSFLAADVSRLSQYEDLMPTCVLANPRQILTIAIFILVKNMQALKRPDYYVIFGCFSIVFFIYKYKLSYQSFIS